MRLSAVNLNLFVVFDALYRHRKAASAAAELGVTPSAVSHSLRELRALLADPLFVRSGSGLQPTARADALEPEVRRAMLALGRAVDSSSDFDPSTSRRRFVVSTSDAPGPTLMKRFVSQVLAKAPHVVLELRAYRTDVEALLDRGDIHLALQLPKSRPAWVGRAHLYSDFMMCVLRPGHPAAGQPLTLEAYRALHHVRVAPDGFGKSGVDEWLEAKGVQRHVTVYAGTFSLAPEMVLATDAVLTLPAHYARAVVPRLGLELAIPEFELPQVDVEVVWHRAQEDAGSRWLREQLMAAARTEFGPQGPR